MALIRRPRHTAPRKSLFTTDGQVTCIKKLFKAYGVIPRRSPAMGRAPNKAWEWVRGEIEKKVERTLYKGLWPGTRQMVIKGQADEFVRKFSLKKYGNTNPESLSKAKQDAIRWFERLNKYAKTMCDARLEMGPMIKKARSEKSEKARREEYFLDNAMDGFGQILGADYGYIQLFPSKLEKLPY